MQIRIVEIDTPQKALREIKKTNADPYSIRLMSEKAYIRAISIKGIDNRSANLLKQEMLSLGGEAAISKDISNFKKGCSDVLILATKRHLKNLFPKLSVQPFGLRDLSEKIETALSNYEKDEFAVFAGKHKLKLTGKKPLVMGTLNVTPDSFSDGGKYCSAHDAVFRALEMESEGADIIDIGGESTRPGSARIGESKEISRILPVIKKLSKRLKIPISVDTYKPDVAKAALDAGAVIVNDITGLRYNKGLMARLASKYGVPVIIMHMQGSPKTMQKKPGYRDVISDISGFFSDRVKHAVENGVKPGQIIIDPGIGFGKLLEHNLEILRRLSEFRALGFPLCVGTSRKSFIGNILGGLPPEQRVYGSISSFIWSALRGAVILRVHDTAETVQALKVLTAIKE